jgi:hypothetical protein
MIMVVGIFDRRDHLAQSARKTIKPLRRHHIVSAEYHDAVHIPVPAQRARYHTLSRGWMFEPRAERRQNNVTAVENHSERPVGCRLADVRRQARATRDEQQGLDMSSATEGHRGFT